MSNLSFHFQSNVVGWLDAVAKAKPRVVKIFQIEMGNATKAVSPNTKTVFRHFVSHQQPYLDKAGEGSVQALEAAAEFINQFEDSLNRQGGIDYVESLNETYATKAPETMRKAIAFDIGFCKALAQICPGVKPIVFTAAIGNPRHDEIGPLLELADVCEAFGGAFGYHAYHPVVNRQSFVDSASHQKNLHLRWDVIDTFLVANGHRVDWFLGEIGPIGANDDGYNLRANDGWKHSGVWGGDLGACIADLAAFDRLLAGTRAAREGRLLGGTLFTSGPWDWKHFQWQGTALAGMADYIAANPSPEPDPLPDPPPDPEPEPRVIDVADQLTRDPANEYNTRRLLNIDAHVVHHTAGRASLTAEEIARYHVNIRGWPGIAYHYYILPDGTINQTNALEAVSYHVGPANYSKIGTALAGNFWSGAGSQRPSVAQERSLRWLHNVHLPAVLGRSIPLLGHKEVPGCATACPGDLWDWHKVVGSTPEPEPEPEPEPDDDVVGVRVVCEPHLNIRSGPSTEYRKLGTLLPGAVVDAEFLSERIDGNKWAHFSGLWAAVRYNGVTLMEVVE